MNTYQPTSASCLQCRDSLGQWPVLLGLPKGQNILSDMTGLSTDFSKGEFVSKSCKYLTETAYSSCYLAMNFQLLEPAVLLRVVLLGRCLSTT